MRFFTLHERPARPGGDPEVLAVASGFRWWAAVVPPLWLLWHRLWLGFALYMLFSIVLGIALAIGDIADPAATAIGLAVSFLIGAGAADYRRWTLQRRGWRFGGVLRASDAAEAEALYIRNRGAGLTAAPPVAVTPSSPQAFPPAVLPRGGSSDAFPRLL
ncbi:DUF2628 domain-containing protein [Ferrovibrio terrae]|uniref:DUF2628 domain-containing protein n=1 Tax=Ferrovibrio terrae TaxID=2594003 RepID=UPI0031379E67